MTLPVPAVGTCPACGSTAARRAFRKGGRDFWRCRDCAAVRQWPLPSPTELAEYYDRSYRDGLYREFTSARPMKDLTASDRLRLVLPACRPGRWLDVGCADGRFVAAARDAGMDACGIDVSVVAVTLGRKEGLPLRRGGFEDLDGHERFDTITAFDVLEHVPDPGGFLRAAHGMLVDGGTFALTVPDLDSAAARLMARHWSLYIPEEHLHYVGRRSVATLLRHHGFAPLTVSPVGKPLTFDYGLTQLREYNPVLFRVAAAGGRLLPRTLRTRPVRVRIGELLAIARRA